MLANLFIALILIIAGLWAFARWRLLGEDLSRFDNPAPTPIGGPERKASAENAAVIARLKSTFYTDRNLPKDARLSDMRRKMDALGNRPDIAAEVRSCDAGGVPAEWVLASGADPARRVLYIHGGGFVAGSPRSHRTITARFSSITGAAVLAIDYRLMPESPRQAGIEDCRTAYRWILDNGPDGPAPAAFLVIAGDSAGGNLTLSTIAWARDAGMRPADAAVALSPATDATFESPSLAANRESDTMLGPVFGRVTQMPRAWLAWGTVMANRMAPNGRLLSPLRGPLHDLPPTLVHASTIEMLYDDANRYVNKAVAEGSPARLEAWNHMLHVWHIFEPELPEAQEAFEHIRQFLDSVEDRQRGTVERSATAG